MIQKMIQYNGPERSLIPFRAVCLHSGPFVFIQGRSHYSMENSVRALLSLLRCSYTITVTGLVSVSSHHQATVIVPPCRTLRN